MPRQFKGVIDLDIRNSKPDWDAFLDSKAPKDAPNVLVILYDDTGQAAWSPYGGRKSVGVTPAVCWIAVWVRESCDWMSDWLMFTRCGWSQLWLPICSPAFL